MKYGKRCTAFLLALVLFFGCVGCAPFYPGPSAAPTPGSVQLDIPQIPASRGPAPENSATWRELFFDHALPEEGYLAENETGFYVTNKDGNNSVIVMDAQTLLSQTAAMEPLPRTHYFQDLLDARFTLLFAAFDMAMELGCRKFSFPTRELRAWDVSEVLLYISHTFFLTYGSPNFSVTPDREGSDGEPFRFMTVVLTEYDQQDLQNCLTALAEARRIVSRLDENWSELEKAKYLYEYVATHVRYDDGEYYEEDWNTLYDALIGHKTVCTGFAEAIYCLFNLAGIDCLYVEGIVDNKIVFGGHAWNLAKVEGEWYVFDATWDASASILTYRPRYFGVSQAAAAYEHPRDLSGFLQDLTPPCEKILDESYLSFLPPASVTNH